MVSAQIAVSPGRLLVLVEPVVKDASGLDHQFEPLPGSFSPQLFKLESECKPGVGVQLAGHQVQVRILWWQ